MNSFLTPIKEFQKNKFIFTQPQKENIINLSRLCMIYLHSKYNIYIYDLMQNEKNWLKNYKNMVLSKGAFSFIQFLDISQILKNSL